MIVLWNLNLKMTYATAFEPVKIYFYTILLINFTGIILYYVLI